MFGVAQEVDINELSDLKVLRGDILDDLREVVRDIAAFGNELLQDALLVRMAFFEWSTHCDETLHGVEFLPVAAGVELFPNVLHFVIWHVKDGRSTACYGEITGVFAEGLLDAHTKSRCIFSKSVEIDVVH